MARIIYPHTARMGIYKGNNIELMNLEDCYLKAYELLVKFGYFNDEQTKLSHQIQHEFTKLKLKIEELGYQGNLDKKGIFSETVGAIYWVFDTDRLSLDEARKLLEKICKIKSTVTCYRPKRER